MRRFVFCLMLAVVIASGIYCMYWYYREEVLPQKQLDKENKEQSELFEHIRPEFPVPDNALQITEITENLLETAEAVNHSVVGWLVIPDTHIDYPICQSDDNDFYLHNGFDGEYNYELGCPFLDYRCNADFSGFNSIVYAHNMEGRAMFADIALYKEETFLNEHNIGYLILEDSVHTVSFFAYLTVPSTAPAYHTVFMTDSERQEYIDYIFDTARYSMLNAVEIHTDLHLILLSTCTFEYEEARGVLVGVIN